MTIKERIDELEAKIEQKHEEINARIKRVQQAKISARKTGHANATADQLTKALGDTQGASRAELQRQKNHGKTVASPTKKPITKRGGKATSPQPPPPLTVERQKTWHAENAGASTTKQPHKRSDSTYKSKPRHTNDS